MQGEGRCRGGGQCRGGSRRGEEDGATREEDSRGRLVEGGGRRHGEEDGATGRRPVEAAAASSMSGAAASRSEAAVFGLTGR